MTTPVFGKITETKHIHPWFTRELLRRYPKAYVYKPQGGAYGKKGAHDFIFCIDGKFFTVEAKVVSNTMSPMQLSTQRNVQGAGGFSECLTGKDETIFERIEKWRTA